MVNLLAFFMHQIFELVRWHVSARAHLLQFPPRVLGRGAVRLPAVPVYLVGPGAGAHELAAGATAAFSVSVVHGLHRCIYASGGPRARQLRTIACAVSPLCALPRRHWLAATPRPRFWRSGDGLVRSPLATAGVNRAHRLENITDLHDSREPGTSRPKSL